MGINEAMLAVSEARSKLNTLSHAETQDADAIKTASGEYEAAEVKLREAIEEADDKQTVVASGEVEPDAEERERVRLRSEVTLYDYVMAVDQQQHLAGAAKECSEAHGCPGLMPLEILDLDGVLRTRAITPAPSTVNQTTAGAMPDPKLQNVASHMNIQMPTAPTGMAAYPILTTPTTAKVLEKSATAPNTAGAYTVTTAKPVRISGAAEFSVEDAALLAGMQETLTRDITAVVNSAHDNLLINGSAASPDLDGLVDVGTNPTEATAVDTFQTFVDKWAKVDGLYARNARAIRALVGPEVANKMLATFVTNSAISAWKHIREEFGGLEASDRVAYKTSSKTQQAFLAFTSLNQRVAVAPRWQGVRIIVDHITGELAGTVRITAVMLASGVKFLRTGAFERVSIKVAT